MPHNLKAPGTRPLERHQWHLTAPPVCRPPPPFKPSWLAGPPQAEGMLNPPSGSCQRQEGRGTSRGVPPMATEFWPLLPDEEVPRGANELLLFLLLNSRNPGPRHSSEGDGNMMQRPAVTVYTNYLLTNTHTPSEASNLLCFPSWVPLLSTSQVPAYLLETTHPSQGLQLAPPGL